MEKVKGEGCPINKLKLSISGKEGCVRIGLEVARILRDSRFLSIYLSPENDAIMVRPCEEKEFLSIKIDKSNVDEMKTDFRLYSLSFVTGIVEQQGWDVNKTYQMIGEYIPSHDAIVFLFKNAKPSILKGYHKGVS